MNEPKSQSTGGTPDAGSLQARLNRVRLEVAAQQSRLARGSFLTAIIGVVLCGLMAVYFGVFYKLVSDMLTPKHLADTAEDVLTRRLPEARRALEPQIKESAPTWARDASNSFQENLPQLRTRSEDLIMKQIEKGLEHVQILTAEQFRGFVQQNRAMLADGFNSFRDPDKAERFLGDLQLAVESSMSTNLREEANELMRVLIDLNRKGEKLKTGQGLNSEEALLREILMIARRLEAQEGEEPQPKRKRSKRPAGAAESEEPKTEEPAAKTPEEKEKPKSEGEEAKPKKEPEPVKKSENN
ncbi:MAG: hypothetical protein HY000_11830 [Planctomycetes bacterium]|nr:hypothetical protein [Planctomycetota bacterium]